ncbi:hypothetical protein DPMN_036999 [Dreissena polymorpha]|uniref:Uncharacterized protein n=1 Tax=Dreissena polymorpha TaxID=45954 RepID=A0A9D4ME42_DREPO|nr:hypothetical protein DPMN_036999 [Dreissena polymorpha]
MSARQAAARRSACTSRFQGINLTCPKRALKGAYHLAVYIAHMTLNRLYVRPPEAHPK